MLRNYFMLNLLLVLLLGVLGFRLYSLSTEAHEIPSKPNVKETVHPDYEKQKPKAVDYSAFDKITDMDLFRPSRVAPTVTVKKEESAPIKNPPKLFGTIILNDNRSAIMEEPDSKVTKMFRLNDLIAGYTVSDIQENKVILMRGDEKVEVRLREDKGIKPVVPKRVTARKPVSNVQKRRTPTRRRSRPVPPRRRPTRVRPPATNPETN